MLATRAGLAIRFAEEEIRPMGRTARGVRGIGVAGDVPTAAVALQVGLAVLVAWVSELRELLGYIGFTLGISAAATIGTYRS